MKRIIFIFSMLLFSASIFGQIDDEQGYIDIELVGPGSADGGTDPANCDIIANYSFQNTTDGGLEIPPGNTASSWSWCIDNLGLPGFINLNQNTSLPVTFTMSNGVTATIIGASYASLTIQYDCGDCEGNNVSHFNIFFGCGSELYQSSVFVGCDGVGPPNPDCVSETIVCVETNCNCIVVCIDGVKYTINNPNNTPGNQHIVCFEGSCIDVYGCDDDVPCKRGKGDIVKIPTAKFDETMIQSGTSVKFELSDASKPYELVLTSMQGEVILQESVKGYEVEIPIGSLKKGIYVVSLKNGNTIINHKFIIN